MIETSLELLELESLNNELGLHLRGHPLVKLEFFDYQVIIVEESLVNVVLDIIVQIRLYMERLI
jgi:hypothetical protein